MRIFQMLYLCSVILLLATPPILGQNLCHLWEVREIVFAAEGDYINPYTEVAMWIDLKGPDSEKRIYGFWDGGKIFRIRVVLTKVGDWTWTSGSNQPKDRGLNLKSGSFTACEWSEQEKRANPNRRGIIQATLDGHSLQYADGTPFFLTGDTWWAASTSGTSK